MGVHIIGGLICMYVQCRAHGIIFFFVHIYVLVWSCVIHTYVFDAFVSLRSGSGKRLKKLHV